MDIVFIRELRLDTVIGVHDWERRVRQSVVLDIEMAWDIRSAAQGDALEHALDYSAVGERLRQMVEASEYLLVETLAERCAQLVMAEFAVPWLRLRLSKPGALAGARDVGVLIERGRRDDG